MSVFETGSPRAGQYNNDLHPEGSFEARVAPVKYRGEGWEGPSESESDDGSDSEIKRDIYSKPPQGSRETAPGKKSCCPISCLTGIKNFIMDRVTAVFKIVLGLIFTTLWTSFFFITRLVNICTLRLITCVRTLVEKNSEEALVSGAMILPAIVAAVFSMIRPTVLNELAREKTTADGLIIDKFTDSFHTMVFNKIESKVAGFLENGGKINNIKASLAYIGYIIAAIIVRVGELIAGVFGIVASILCVLANVVVRTAAMNSATNKVLRFTFKNLAIVALVNDILYALSKALNPTDYKKSQKCY